MNYKQDGHAFVCDGYKSTLSGYKFHFNWGWLGQGNGYFTLDDLTPGAGNFSFNQMAIFNIQPSFCWQDLVFQCEQLYTDGDEVVLDAVNNIENNQYDFEVQCNADVGMHAGNEIVLTDGFHAAQGSFFLANIASCGVTNVRSLLAEEDLSDIEPVIDYKISNTLIDVIQNLVLYPNPTNGKLRIENGELTIEGVEVYDVYGKLLQTLTVNDVAADLDVTHLPAGLYFARIRTDNGVVTKRFVKR